MRKETVNFVTIAIPLSLKIFGKVSFRISVLEML